MADDDLDPPSPLASRLFAAEKRRPEASSDVVAGRVLARVTATVVAGAALGTAAAAKAAAAQTGASTVASTSTSASAATTTGAASLGLTAKALPWIVGAFVVGGGTGAALHANFTPSHVAMVPTVASSVAPPVATLTAAPPASASVPVVTPHDLPSSVPAVAPKPSVAPSPSNAPDLELAAERALVDRARSALSAGQPSAAVDAVDAHATRFPKGRLAEEREALAVQALARSGNTTAAKRRADAFRKTYPNSIFGPAVDLAAP